MREHVRNVGTTKLTVIVNDKSPFQQQMAAVASVVSWLQAARLCLIDAIAYTTLALTRPELVHPVYWESLYYYFGIPITDPRLGTYATPINQIRNTLIITSNGLNGDVTVGDITELPGIYGLLFGLNKSADDLKKEFGVVHQSIGDNLADATRDLLGIPQPRETGPLARDSHIYVNFSVLMSKAQWWGVVTLIHEATHKYARTIDAQYFAPTDGDLWSLYQTAAANVTALRTLTGLANPPDTLMAEARVMVTARLGKGPVENIRAMPRADALNNADGLARYAHSILEFPDWR